MLQIEFEFERDTKNKVRFAEVVEGRDPQMVGTLYIDKFAMKELGKGDINRVRVTIEAVN